jgi:hypothetical protein
MKLRMEETWLYREGVEKGAEQKLDEIQQALLKLWRERFGHDELGEQRIRRIRDTDKLLALLVRTATAQSPSEALGTFLTD